MKMLLKGILFLFLGLGLFACGADGEPRENSVPDDYEGGAENNLTEYEDSDEAAGNEASNEDPVENESNSDENEAGENVADEVSWDIDIYSDTSVTVLVNKFNSLSDYYEPEDLVTVGVPTILENPEVNQLRQIAADALYDMFEEAKRSEVILYARSGYRSYGTQIYLFDSYAEKHGEEAANQFSARPGFSEHQTGLVMDVTSESVNYQLTREFGKTKEGLWLADNAHKFGFIIRYLEGKEDITGYVYEPWHVRYVGVDLATAIYESGLSYEEFLVEEGIIHAVNANAKE